MYLAILSSHLLNFLAGEFMYKTYQKGLEYINDRYLQERDLEVIDRYVASFPLRVATHQQLRRSAEQLVNAALEEFAKTEPEAIAQHRHLCARDLHFILQMTANVVINDHRAGFTDSLLWLQNVLRSMHKESTSAKAYKILQGMIAQQLSAEQCALIEPYLSQAINMLSLTV
jgi:ATP-dependent Clp protease ATP-binding subunit ClpA